jgi:two-component SAPR family response regulator
MDACIAIGFICEFESNFVSEILKKLNRYRTSNIIKLLLLYGENNTITNFLQMKFEMSSDFQEDFDMIHLNLLMGKEENLHSYIKAAENTRILKNDLPNMIVKCFGKFQLFCYHGDNILIKWRTQKAKELMAYFIHNAEKTVHTEQILADLWPDTEVEKARDLFYTNISLVRKILVECKLKDNLTKNQLGYCLKKDHILCDEWLVEQYSKRGLYEEKGINNLLENDYLEDVYSEWALEIRNYYSLFINT